MILFLKRLGDPLMINALYFSVESRRSRLEYCIFALRPWKMETDPMHTESSLLLRMVMLPFSPIILLKMVI